LWRSTGPLGYTHEELLGLTVEDIVMDYDRTALEALWSELMTSPQTVLVTHRRKDGSTLLVEGRLSPFEYRGQLLILAVVRDITERKRAEEERRALEQHMEDQKRSFYRDTILSVTDGKLDICDDREVAPYISSSQVRIDVDSAKEVSVARRGVEEFLREHGLDGDRLNAFMIGVGEAITNAVKHGTKGTVYANTLDGTMWVGIADNGPGIESLILPRAVLLKGFSTKPSLGLGYCVMLDVADRIHLKTDENGTVVILEKQLQEVSELALWDLPDTWDQTELEERI
jgi:anti-sigma regulatory factor (Ser/Thr protein kinase)